MTQAGPPDERRTPVGRLRERRDFWRRAMVEMVCFGALTLSILASGYLLEWKNGAPASPTRQPNHRSATEESAFVAGAIEEGDRFGTMARCRREDLQCILPLGVAVNAAGKKRLIWDGRWVNEFLGEQRFNMETLHGEGRALLGEGVWGGTFDISQAYHHVDMHESTFPFLEFEWDGGFFHFVVLPFGRTTSAGW